MRARTANGIEPRTLGQFAGTRVVPRTCALLQVVVVFALSGAVTRNTPQETDRTSPHENISVQVHTQEQLQRKAMPASIHMHQQGTSGAAPQVLAESRIPRRWAEPRPPAPPLLPACRQHKSAFVARDYRDASPPQVRGGSPPGCLFAAAWIARACTDGRQAGIPQAHGVSVHIAPAPRFRPCSRPLAGTCPIDRANIRSPLHGVVQPLMPSASPSDSIAPPWAGAATGGPRVSSRDSAWPI